MFVNIALFIYLLVLIFIAVKSAGRVRDIPDFFVARKGASVKAVTGSLVATILGGSAVIGAVDSGVRLGGAASWFMLTGALGLLALIPFAERAYRLGRYSLPDLVGNIYGSGPRMVASVIIPIAWTGIVAAQIIASAKLLMTFTPLGYTEAAIFSAVVFTAYTAAGGQYSILRTDLFQAFLIVTGLFVLSGSVMFADGTSAALVLQKAPAFPFNENFTPFELFLLVLTYGTTFTAGPDMFSRIFCAKDASTAKKAIAAAAAILVPVAFVIGFLAAYGTGIEGEGAKITLIALRILPEPLVPLIALSLLSVVLSSADTTLLSSSVIFCGIFRDQKTTLPKVRTVIVLNGILALLLALVFTDIIGTLLLALAVYAGAFTVPVLWGLAGFTTRPKFVAAAVISGGILALAGKLLPVFADQAGRHTGDLLMIAAFVVNALCLFAGNRFSHFRKNRV